MEEDAQKEKLEQELGFLKESFAAEVISKEEYEKGRERIEKKLKEMERLPAQDSKENEKKSKPSEKSDERIKLKVIQDEEGDEQQAAHSRELNLPKESKKEKKKSKFISYAVIFIVLLIAAFFSYSFLKGYASSPQDKKIPSDKMIAANNAVSKINEAPKTEVTVLNEKKDCFNCDTRRVLNILDGMLGGIRAKEVDYDTNEGKALAEKFGLRMLPAYILDEGIEKNENYERIRQIFTEKEGKYVLSEDASGASFYFKRENIPNKLDFFAISGDNTNIKAEKNLKEFLDAFNEAKFEKHSSEDNLAKEIGIKNFPSFLVNNRIRFSGVYSAESIKENFCAVNKLEACKKILKKSLV